MRNNKAFLPFIAVLVTFFTAVTSCSDDESVIGGSLTDGEVNISIDSTFTISGHSTLTNEFDARSGTLLLGRVNCPEYGDLRASFVAQLMPASAMTLSDTIGVERVDSMVLKLSYRRGAFTGDSLAPQQVRVYALEKQLPQDISNVFDPTGYYNPRNPLGLKNFTASALGTNDSVFLKETHGHINVKMPLDLARRFFTAYRETPEIFSWPQTFAQYFPGIYVENSFGAGCVVNITVAEMPIYYHVGKSIVEIVDGETVRKTVNVKDSVTLFSTAPEALSSNVVNLDVSENLKKLAGEEKSLVVAPCGYRTDVIFPAQDILDKYWKADFNLAVINNLTLTIPGNTIKNSFGITPPPYLLLIKTKELDSFFAENKVPDGISSFWGTYSSTTKDYTFTSMRQYIVNLMKAGKSVDPSDTEFSIIAVNITTDTTLGSQTVVTKCVPFVLRPVMTLLDLKNAKIKFTFSSQVIE